MEFRNLHHQDTPVLICNVWDAASARVAQKAGFKAIGTSSAAIAALLGYKDGAGISFRELAYLVERVITATSLPLTVDMESGYSREPNAIVANIRALSDLGIVGINLEDSIVDGSRSLQNAEVFAATIAAIKAGLANSGTDIFLNVRTDTFLLGCADAVEDTVRRGRLYAAAGADGLFVPCIEKAHDIEVVVQSTALPVNVMCMPQLPSFKTLQALGVKRISMGNFLFDGMYRHLEDSFKAIQADQSFERVFQHADR